MSENNLYFKLMNETANITWPELEPFFARGALLWVAGSMDLIAAAQAVAEDNKSQVALWIDQQQLKPIASEQAQDWQTRSPELWAVVVAPWVLVQERQGRASTN